MKRELTTSLLKLLQWQNNKTLNRKATPSGCFILYLPYYPANYGFIPRTFGDDNDPLDVLILCSEELEPLTLVRCYPIGYISMFDGGRMDEKIIAISFADPTYNKYKDISELPEHIFDEMKHFFRVYKELERKETITGETSDRKAAVKVIGAALNNYIENFCK